MARVLKGSHSFTCTPRVHPLTEWTIYLCLPSRCWYSFTDPAGMEGWVGLGWLVGYIPKWVSGNGNRTRTWSPISVLTDDDDDDECVCVCVLVRLVLGISELRRRGSSSLWSRWRLVPRQRQFRRALHSQPQFQITVKHSPHAHWTLQRYVVRVDITLH